MRFHLFSIYHLIYWLISPIFSHFYNTHTASLLFPMLLFRNACHEWPSCFALLTSLSIDMVSKNFIFQPGNTGVKSSKRIGVKLSLAI